MKEAAQWKWSSFRHYAFRGVGVVEIESEWTARDREVKALGLPPRIFTGPSSTVAQVSPTDGRTWGTQDSYLGHQPADEFGTIELYGWWKNR